MESESIRHLQKYSFQFLHRQMKNRRTGPDSIITILLRKILEMHLPHRNTAVLLCNPAELFRSVQRLHAESVRKKSPCIPSGTAAKIQNERFCSQLVCKFPAQFFHICILRAGSEGCCVLIVVVDRLFCLCHICTCFP